MNYYEVTTKCGHVGRQKCIIINFPINAVNAKEAARIARNIPRVKHDHKDAILGVKKIDYQRFEELQELNRKDPYLKCLNIQEQNQIMDLDERIIPDVSNIDEVIKRIPDNVKRNKKIIRNFKKYQRYIDTYKEDNEEWNMLYA